MKVQLHAHSATAELAVFKHNRLTCVVQLADDIAAIPEDAQDHPNVHLESKAFAGLPVQVAEYIAHVEQILTRVHRLADSLELAARCARIQWSAPA